MPTIEKQVPTVGLKNSVALHLLKVVFSLYLGITITLTITHMSIEYLEQKKEIEREFIGIQESFEISLSNSLWEYFDSQLDSVLVGMEKLPSILGIKIIGADQEVVSMMGLVYNQKGQHIYAHKDKSISQHKSEISLQTFEFPLTHVKTSEAEIIGKAVLFYDSQLAYQRVKLGFLVIIINSALKTVALWAIFIFFSRKVLTQPLSELANAAENLQLESLTGDEEIFLKTKGRNELKVLEESFNKMIRKLYHSKEELADINHLLEKKVSQRTLALNEAMLKLQDQHKELENKHRDLMTTQSQLVQSEKMAGLGTLVAGVAHEINNPMNFVYVNSRSLQEYLKTFQTFLFEMAGGDEADREVTEVLSRKFEEMFELTQDIIEGGERIKTVVVDLRKFSRLEETDRKDASLEEGIRTTLRLVQSSFRKQVQFSCKYGDIPMIECWPAELNQVFMNLLVNACQAIVEKYSLGIPMFQGEVSIETFTHDQWVGVRIQDNGIGFSSEIKKHIFDPFFTTKDIGDGTGLGLSISYGIIEKHQGRIEVDSTVGKGTTFTVFLPGGH